MGKRSSEMACGCKRIEGATLAEASDWLENTIEGQTDVQICIVVGGDRCTFYNARTKPFSVGSFGPRRKGETE